jgi:hypothetical protein
MDHDERQKRRYRRQRAALCRELLGQEAAWQTRTVVEEKKTIEPTPAARLHDRGGRTASRRAMSPKFSLEKFWICPM